MKTQQEQCLGMNGSDYTSAAFLCMLDAREETEWHVIHILNLHVKILAIWSRSVGQDEA